MNIPDFAASLVTFFCVPEESSLKGKKKNNGRWDALGYCKVAFKTLLFRYSNIIPDFIFETTHKLRFAVYVCNKGKKS